MVSCGGSRPVRAGVSTRQGGVMRLMAAKAMTPWSFAMTDESAHTILVVDEEPQILRLVCLILSRERYRVLAARSIQEAARLADEHHGFIHLLLIDGFVAGAADPGVIEQLRAACAQMQTVIMSDSETETQSGVRLLVKPFTPETLRQVVREALQPDF